MAKSIKLSMISFIVIALIEIVGVIRFLLPRTGTIGTVVLVTYMGGAMATHVTHGQSMIAPAYIEAIIGIVAAIRLPELKHRLVNSNKQG